MAVTVTSISPSQVGRNVHFYQFQVIGTSFAAGAVASFGSGVTVLSTTVLSATELRVELTISSAATLGTRTPTVTNLDASSGSLTNGLTIVTLSAAFYQPITYSRSQVVYDPRADASPYLYFTHTSSLYRLNRSTGAITLFSGSQFNQWISGSYGPSDLDTDGNMWWIGNEPNNLTTARQAQTKFTADTFTKIGSMTSDGSTIVYPIAGQVRVDRHSSHHFVWHIDQADSHSDHGNLTAWDGVTRVRVYTLGHASWDNQPVAGTRNRVWDFDSDGDGNLWVITKDDSSQYVLFWKVTPLGAQTLVANLSSFLPALDTNTPMLKWVSSDNSLVICYKTALLKYNTSGSQTLTGTVPVVVQSLQNYQSWHHTLDTLTSVYIVVPGTTGPVFYEMNLLTLTLKRSIDFAGVSGCVGVFFNGFNQAYDSSRVYSPITAFYDPILGGCWCEEFYSGVAGGFVFGDILPTPPEPPEPPSGPTGLYLLEHVEGLPT